MADMIGHPTKGRFSPRATFGNLYFRRLKQITDLVHRYGGYYVKHTDGNMNSLLGRY